MLVELEDRFPQHDFLLGDVHFAEYERTILALLDDVGSSRPDPKSVGEAVDYFRTILTEIERWKPS